MALPRGSHNNIPCVDCRGLRGGVAALRRRVPARGPSTRSLACRDPTRNVDGQVTLVGPHAVRDLRPVPQGLRAVRFLVNSISNIEAEACDLGNVMEARPQFLHSTFVVDSARLSLRKRWPFLCVRHRPPRSRLSYSRAGEQRERERGFKNGDVLFFLDKIKI